MKTTVFRIACDLCGEFNDYEHEDKAKVDFVTIALSEGEHEARKYARKEVCRACAGKVKTALDGLTRK